MSKKIAMTPKFLFILITVSCICMSAIGQSTIKGVVLDKDTKEVLPFVNIGIRQKNIGTSSLIDGTFSIQIPTRNENDTLTISMVGYYDLNMPIKNITTSDKSTFQLKIKTIDLQQGVVSTRKLVEQKFGIKNNKALIHFLDGSTNQNDIFEIAQLINLDTTISKITSVNLHINNPRKDSGIFRINFYQFDGVRPGERIIEKSIVQKKDIKEGWLRFDLSAYDIHLSGRFVVAIEFIPTPMKNNPIYYEVKLGGSSKSFVRTSSQGDWAVPPHHYRLFVTALVSDKKHKIHPEDSEEKETVPTATLFSQFVNDSFSIFVSLPKNYSPKKNQNFPVIYLLDGNAYFDIIANEMVEKHTNAILVGIGYKDAVAMMSLRDRDYTYPIESSKDTFKISGGGDKFLSFIAHELVPYIDSTYQTALGERTLMGHSLGGYFTLFALEEMLLEKNMLFKYFVAASPSIEYCGNYLPKQFQKIIGNNIPDQPYLLLTIGGKEDANDGTGTMQMDNFNSLEAILSNKQNGKINVATEIYPTFGHMETAIPTFTKALKKIL